MPGTKARGLPILFKTNKKTIMKTNHTKTTHKNNLIGEANFQQFLEIQAAYGYSQRGGSTLPGYFNVQSKRLVSDINILESSELKKLVFNELIFGN